jgi:hypothetical protein
MKPSLIINDRCVICGKKTNHKNIKNVTYLQITIHRKTERRDCLNYEDCLMQAALDDAICVPCVICINFIIKG